MSGAAPTNPALAPRRSRRGRVIVVVGALVLAGIALLGVLLRRDIVIAWRIEQLGSANIEARRAAAIELATIGRGNERLRSALLVARERFPDDPVLLLCLYEVSDDDARFELVLEHVQQTLASRRVTRSGSAVSILPDLANPDSFPALTVAPGHTFNVTYARRLVSTLAELTVRPRDESSPLLIAPIAWTAWPPRTGPLDEGSLGLGALPSQPTWVAERVFEEIEVPASAPSGSYELVLEVVLFDRDGVELDIDDDRLTVPLITLIVPERGDLARRRDR